MAAEASGSRRRVRGGLLAGGLALVVLALGGWGLVRGDLLGRSAAAPPAPQIPTGTAVVTRGDIVQRQPVPGTLGYGASAPVVAQAAGASPGAGGEPPAGGILTRLPAPGAVITKGQALYEVDGRPVPLWYGARPAWRAFQPGMADGPDVRQLETNLVALGFDPSHAITIDRHFSRATAAAVRRWQRNAGLPQTGSVPLGGVVFRSGPIRVASLAGTVGAPVQPGEPVLAATSTRPVVTVALDPNLQQLVRRGDRVEVILPGGETAQGAVATVGRAAVLPGAAGPDGAQRQDQGGDQPEEAAIPVTIRLSDPRATRGLDQASVQVAITTETHRDVLTVPIAALLARQGGGYAVAVVSGGTTRQVPVRTDLFDEAGGLVEVAGPGLAEGARVEVPTP